MTAKVVASSYIDPETKEVVCKVYHDGQLIYNRRSEMTERKTAELIRSIMAEPEGDIELVESEGERCK